MKSKVSRLSILGCLFLIILSCPHNIRAQWKQDVWSIEDGLPTNVIFDLHQSKAGYIWIATDNGISVFDGISFRNFNSRNTKAFKTNQIQTIFEDNQGTIWIGTSHGGLVKYEDHTFERPFGKQKNINQNILTINEDASGDLLVGTDGGGLAKIKADTVISYNAQNGFISNHVSILHSMKTGDILAGTLDAGFTVLGTDSMHMSSNGSQVMPNTITSFESDDSGNLWVGTSNKLFLRRDSAFTSFDLSGFAPDANTIRAALLSRDNTLWVGTQHGLYVKTATSHSLEEVAGFNGKVIGDIIQDRESNIWVSAFPDGLFRLKKTTFQTLIELDSNQDGIPVSIIQKDQADFWIATTKKIIHLSDNSREEFNFNSFENTPQINDLQEGSGNTLWIATNLGLYQFKNGTMRRVFLSETRTPHGIQDLMAKADGTICAATLTQGVSCFDEEHPQEAKPVRGLSNDRVLGIDEDSKNNFWVGTAYGLNKVRGDSSIAQFTETEGLSSSVIRAVHADEQNTIWLGTNGGGLNRFKNGTFFHFSDEDGLNSRTIFHILQDDYQNLWLIGVDGMYKASISSLNSYADGKSETVDWEFYDAQSGLLSPLMTGYSYKSPLDGKVYVLTKNGISYTDPSEKVHAGIPPLINLQNILIDFNEVPYPDGGKLILQPDELNLEIKYAGISMSAPEDVSYKYRLEGFDQKWHHVENRRSAFYTNLDPGTYTFQVKARSRDGVWSEKAATLPIIVEAAFYETMLFKILILLAIIGGIGLLYWYRLMNLKKIENLRIQIANDLHDEIGSNLGSIALRSRLISQHPYIDDEEEEGLKEIDRLSRQTAESMRDIIWFINPGGDTIEDLTNKLRQTANTLLGNLPHHFDTDLHDPEQHISLSGRRNITLMFKEALHNVVKHANATKIDIQLKTDVANLHLSIRDNGCGFNPGEKKNSSHSGMGLNNLKKRTDKLDGDLQISSTPGNGCHLQWSIPLK
ncbi:sensor histidine kinase [Fodinibius halophilus]|uniref:Histidine kinase domain-containing protein n=1 Tax=Fodinibius halophilus TaxID=1736908 RepID=A0A6M1TP80_9BACT|nr:sensor histidine kinase [Fodinibius halophilus]NGP90110.1 hypothetical protein [Fodinibius halophilus]